MQVASLNTQVTVADGGPSPKQSTVWVLVQVLDENDNKPEFPEKVYQIRLPERDRKKRGEPIYRAFAWDRDEGPNAEIAYSIAEGNEDGRFFIDPKTGMVTSRKQFSAGSYDILTVREPPATVWEGSFFTHTHPPEHGLLRPKCRPTYYWSPNPHPVAMPSGGPAPAYSLCHLPSPQLSPDFQRGSGPQQGHPAPCTPTTSSQRQRTLPLVRAMGYITALCIVRTKRNA